MMSTRVGVLSVKGHIYLKGLPDEMCLKCRKRELVRVLPVQYGETQQGHSPFSAQCVC